MLYRDLKLTIVIVDDSPFEHIFVKEALRDFKNILFNDYYSGEDFLHFLEEKNKKPPLLQQFPDIVILDVNMPRMTGFELFDLIEKKGLKDHIQFYVLTNSITEFEKKNCGKYKLKCYRKPFSIDHFTELLEEIIKDSLKK